MDVVFRAHARARRGSAVKGLSEGLVIAVNFEFGEFLDLKITSKRCKMMVFVNWPTVNDTVMELNFFHF